jgi:hypothetical protein
LRILKNYYTLSTYRLHLKNMKKINYLFLVLSLSFVTLSTFAAPPSTPYTPNETLNPGCAPWDINCIVTLSFLTWEVDPVFTLSPSFNIGNSNISNWNSAFSWWNHATQGYLTGTKVSQLNWLSSSSQNFAIGTSGTGFTISSTWTIHTFNIPFATGGISGFLRWNDWNIFNSKQNTLVAGVGIDISGNTISTTGTSGWQLGWSAGGGSTLGSSDSALPFMSNGNTMMQLNNSNLSLSNNASFVDSTWTNGLFIGNALSYQNSSNTLWIGESISIWDNNKNTFLLGDQIETINTNTNSFFWGEILAGIEKNNNVFSFWNRNRLNNNNNSILFGFENRWNDENDKFIVWNGDKRWLQVDMRNGEILFNGNSWNAGEVLMSQWSSANPVWTSIVSNINSINGLFDTSQSFATGSTGNNFSISSVWWVHTFNLPNASSLNRWLLSALDWGIFNAKQNTISIWTPWNGLTFSGTVLNLGLASTTTTGALSPNDWSTFNSKISSALTSINTLTGSTQNFAVWTTWNGFSITSTWSTHTFNISDASTITRWLMGTGAQSFTWAKIFTVNPTLSSMTLGSIPFISTGWLLSENSSRLFWDNTNSQLLTFSGGTWALPTYSFFGDNDTGMYHPGANVLWFSAGGNVVGRMTNLWWSMGDGSINPVSLVHIAGGANPATFRMSNAISLNTVSDGFFINYSTGNIVSLSNLENADMWFGTNNSERMRILANGNIAISQTWATEKLEVNGGIKIGTSATTCNAAAAGAIRYNSGTNKHEWCNGTAWTALY